MGTPLVAWWGVGDHRTGIRDGVAGVSSQVCCWRDGHLPQIPSVSHVTSMGHGPWSKCGFCHWDKFLGILSFWGASVLPFCS